MSVKLERFAIKNLYGYKNFDVDFEDNKLILVGENGTSKSTIVSMFYSFVTKQWKKLREFEFEEMMVVINGNELRLTRRELLSNTKSLYKAHHFILERLKVLHITPEYALDHLDPELARAIGGGAGSHRFPSSVIRGVLTDLCSKQDQLFAFEQDNLTEIEKHLDFRILYLPTYRRIERDLKTIFPALEEGIDRYNRNVSKVDDDRKHIELVEFGMEDVMSLINSTMSSINNSFRTSLSSLTGGYLRVVLRKEYKSADLAALKAIPLEILDNIMSRIDESILSKADRQTLLNTIEDLKNKETASDTASDIDLISAHIISEIVLLHKKQYEREDNVRTFAKVCNKYLRGKRFEFNNDHFTLPIKPIIDSAELKATSCIIDEVKLSMLSSGEKQIVSLFAHLYLTGHSNYILIIDEPELSLSVPWQQTFLPDILNTNRCISLIAVTHSPFIYKNELANNAHSIEEFVSE